MKLLFVGDVMLGRLVNRELSRRPPHYPWGDTARVLKEADVRICNLECVITDIGRPWSATHKTFHFRTDARNIESLKAGGFDLVSLANNHSLDYEYDALFDMMGTLEAAGIRHAGAGRDLEEASMPVFIESGNSRAAMISFTDNEPGWEAKDRKPGVYYVPTDLKDRRSERLFKKVAAARREADIVIVAAHWGPNWGYRPAQGHVPFGRKLIESGATIVFGHSCHVFQGVEFYGDGAIIYSAGNFVDDYAVDEVEKNDESFIFLVDASEGRVNSIRLYPAIIDDFHAGLADFPRTELIAAKMITLCSELGSEAEWNEEGRFLEMVPAQSLKRAISP